MPDRPAGADGIPVARRAAMPSKLFAVQIMMIVGGVVALVTGFAWIASFIGILWPGTYYSLVLGVWLLYRGATLPQRFHAPRRTAVAQIVNILAGDLINVGLGIVELVLLADPECDDYFDKRADAPRY